MSLFRPAALVTAALLIYACASGEMQLDSVDGDTDVGATPAGSPIGSESPDVAFLRAMIDHHEGLLFVIMTAMNNTSREATRSHAQRLHRQRTAERDSMVALLRRTFAVGHTPRIDPADIVKADSIPNREGEARDALFYRILARHHEDGVRLIERHTGELQDPAVRTLAEQLKATKETALSTYSTPN
ncbi:MAG TPA: DUF305 domain-containing protein [Gemmatimonadaceae bacterium]|nr:DUF305 domain-containing protein [Gemmatimonadaceae bacterium]